MIQRPSSLSAFFAEDELGFFFWQTERADKGELAPGRAPRIVRAEENMIRAKRRNALLLPTAAAPNRTKTRCRYIFPFRRAAPPPHARAEIPPMCAAMTGEPPKRGSIFEHLRSAVNGVGDSDVDSCVKDRYHAERAYLFVYQEHPLVVREEA